jgi:ATP-dependent RNA helicase DeaD
MTRRRPAGEDKTDENHKSAGGLPESSRALPEITLEDLPDQLQDAARQMGWTALLPVQAKAIPYLRSGRALMVQSRTGTGKTAAFVLPILERIESGSPRCQALVLVPTRELARQVCAEAERLATGTGIRPVAVYGGVGYGPQLTALRTGAQLVVGTPGRVLDHLMKGSLILDDLKILIFDEADRMLSVGFYPDMQRVARYLPAEHDAFMFSATFPRGVRSLASEFLRQPSFLSLSRDGEHVAATVHVYYEVPAMEKDRCLVRVIEIENPDSAIVFCNTKATARYVSVVLERFGYDAAQLSADLNQSAREKVLARIYQKKLRFLVATDVAARGIDIEQLSHVFLYDFPEDPEMYIHRTGRTGRAGASGEAVSLVDVLEKMRLTKVVRQYNIDMEERPLPTDEDVQAIVAERVTALLEARLRDLDGLVRERMQRMLSLARNFGENDDELAIIAMLLDEYYQKILHAPPELPSGAGETVASQPPPRARAGRSDGRRRRRPAGRR